MTYYESSRFFSNPFKMPHGMATAQGWFGVVIAIIVEIRLMKSQTIENPSLSFLPIRTQGLALFEPLSLPRQDPPVTIWLLLELVDGMQARLTLPSANWDRL